LLTAAEPLFTQLDLFRAGEDGYRSYRILSIIATRKGTLLAFCEGRRNSIVCVSVGRTSVRAGLQARCVVTQFG
jgi:hypothetical protein